MTKLKWDKVSIENLDRRHRLRELSIKYENASKMIENQTHVSDDTKLSKKHLDNIDKSKKSANKLENNTSNKKRKKYKRNFQFIFSLPEGGDIHIGIETRSNKYDFNHEWLRQAIASLSSFLSLNHKIVGNIFDSPLVKAGIDKMLQSKDDILNVTLTFNFE